MKWRAWNNWIPFIGKQKIISFDYGGKKYANLLEEEILSSRVNRFSYESWPFPLQDQEELNMMLYYYGVVAYFKYPLNIEGEQLIFIPVILKNLGSTKFNYITKFNSQNWDFEFELFDNYNKLNKTTINKKQILDNLQFIFTLTTQNIPEQIFNVTKKMTGDTVNAMIANKQNKLPVELVKNKDMNQALLSRKEIRTITGDFSPTEDIDELVPTKEGKIPEFYKSAMTQAAPDLYNSLSTEMRDWKNEMFIVSGIKPSELIFTKSSAQETQGQSQPKLLRAIENYKNELKVQKKSFDNLNKIFSKQVKVTETANYLKWISWSEKLLDFKDNKEGTK